MKWVIVGLIILSILWFVTYRQKLSEDKYRQKMLGTCGLPKPHDPHTYTRSFGPMKCKGVPYGE